MFYLNFKDIKAETVDNEYYSFLHVSRTASDEEIVSAYKKFSRLYHPDKHRDEDDKKKAEVMFAKLKNAYEGSLLKRVLYCWLKILTSFNYFILI